MKNVRGGKRLLAIMLAVCMLSQNVSLETFAAEKKTYDKEDMQTEVATDKYEEEVETENLEIPEETEAEDKLVTETENESTSQSIIESELSSESESLKQSEETEERSSNQSIEESSETEIAETEMIDSETTENLEDEGSTTTESSETETEKEISEDFDVNANILSGKCGDNLTWTLEDGTLTISGTGEMEYYSSTYSSELGRYITTAPWGEYASAFKSLVIEEGITEIGNCAFYGCSSFLGKLEIPNSVTRIGYSAFRNCSGFDGDLLIPQGVTSIESCSFEDCNGFDGDLIISGSVTTIESYAFYNCSGFAGNLEIHEGVNIIRVGAFQGCNGFRGELTIPDSVTGIEANAFQSCSGFRGNLTIPDSVTGIGGRAFQGCSGFDGELIISNSTTGIGEYAFQGCSGFRGELIIPNSVIAIGRFAFSECSNLDGNLKLSENVKTIGQGAFYNCSSLVGDLILPNSIEKLGDNFSMTWQDGLGVFEGCSGFDGKLSIGNGIDQIFRRCFSDCSGLTGDLVIPQGVTSIGELAFSGCSGFTGDLIIPEGVTSIGFSAFQNCNGFTGKLTIPNGITSINYRTFYNCSSITGDLIIPEGVTSIGSNAFYNCKGFTGNLAIPKSVISIGEEAFCYCNGFVGDLVIPNDTTIIEKRTFYGCSGFTGKLTLSESITSIGESAFSGCSGFTGDLTIPDSVISIGYSAFSNCSGFTGDLIIPKSVESIENTTFSFCSGFTGDLTIPDSVISIGSGAFRDCSGFTGDLIIPKSVESIGYSAFSNCSGFTGKLIIPDSVTSIESEAFLNCSGFTGKLMIPDSVTSIESEAFKGCKGFTGDLIIPKSVTSIGNDAFKDCDGITGDLVIGKGTIKIVDHFFSGCRDFIGNLIIPDSVTSIGSSAFSGCSGFIGDLIIPKSVTSIGSSAFSGCSGFTGDLIIPNSVTSIESYVFSNCSGFTGNLIIPNGVTSIGRGAFQGCSGLTENLIIPESVTSIQQYAFSGCSGVSQIIFNGNPPYMIVDSVFSGVKAKVYYPSWINEWKKIADDNFFGTLTWIPYEKGTKPWEMDSDEKAPQIWAYFSADFSDLHYNAETGYNVKEFNLNMNTFYLPIDLTTNPSYENVKVELSLPQGLSFSSTEKVIELTDDIGTLDAVNKRKTSLYKVYVTSDKWVDEFLISAIITVDGYENPQVYTYSIPIKLDYEEKESPIIGVVSRYTNQEEVEGYLALVDDLNKHNYSDEEAQRIIFGYFCCNNWSNVLEQITLLQDSWDERWAYNGLIMDEMYTAWQYQNYLNNTEKGKAARAALWTSGLVFNGELDAYLDPGTYLDADLPGIKDYKSMLKEFIGEKNAEIETYSYIKETEKILQSTVGIWSDLEKESVLKKLKNAGDKETCQTYFNNFVAEKIGSSGIEGTELVVVNKGDKPKFMQALDITGDIFTITNMSVDFATQMADASANIEVYETWHSFLVEISNAKDLPWEMRVAAYQLDIEMKQAYLVPVQNVFNKVRDKCVNKALDATVWKEVVSLGGYTDTLDISASIINSFVDIGALIVNSKKTEGYAYLSNHYKTKLQNCKTAFLNNKSEENAWAFYEAYVMLYNLRVAGENQFIKMSKLQGNNIVDGLSECTTGGTIGGLISDLCGYKDKEACVNEILKRLETFKFQYDLNADTSVPQNYKYLQKIVVKCPVSVEFLTVDGTSIYKLEDKTECDIENEYGCFRAFYNPAEGDYIKIGYFKSSDSVQVVAVGQDEGDVTYTQAVTNDNITCDRTGFAKQKVVTNEIIKINTAEDTYLIDVKGDGENIIEAPKADVSKVFVQFDYDNGKTIEIKYVDSEGKVEMPEVPKKENAEFSGWYLEPQGQGEKFVNNMIKESLTVYAYWTESAKETLSAPSASITSGSAVKRGTKVSLTCPAAGATIYYTTDGTDPTMESLCFTEPIEISQDMVIKAFAAKEGYMNSDIVTFTYTAIVEPNVYFVSFDSKGGSAVSGQNVEENAKATEPQAPTREGYRFLGWYLNGALYDFDTPVTGDLTLEAGWEEYDSLPAPSSNIQSGSKVRKGTKILLTCVESGADIYYTTDGTEPTVESLRYTDPIEILKDITIKAFAVKEGYKSSEVVIFTYVVSDGSGEDEPGQDDNPEGVLPEDIPTDGIPEGLWIAGIDCNGYLYTGKAINPEVRVYDSDRRLTAGKDYTIAYKNNTKANDASDAKTAPSVVVKGKANYAGTETATFKILPVDLGSAEVLVENIVVANNGKVQKKVPTLTFNGKKLANNKDFTVSYPATGQDAYKSAGTYDVLMTAKANGNFTGTKVVKLTVTDSTLISKASVKKLTNQPYTGEVIMPKPKVTYKGKPLSEGTDYTLTYENNTEIGTATVILTGIGAYAGTKKVNFKITGTSLKGAKVTVADVVYDGSAQTPKPQVELNGATLREGEDYTVAYQNNIKAGKATITISGIKSYSGTLKKTFHITAYDLGQDVDKVLAGWSDALTAKYTKGGSKPELQLQFKGTALIAGEDYTVSYSNNKAITSATTKKQPTVTIKGKRNFKGSLTKTFEIVRKDLNDTEQPVRMMVADVAFKDNPGNYISKPILTDTDGKKLVAGTDYEKQITYELPDKTPLDAKSKLDIGAVITVTVTGKGAYTGTRTATYCITKSDFSKAKISISPQIYTGKPIVPGEKDITVKIGNNPPLTYGTDYEIVADSYTNNVKKGTASVTVIGKGNYGGMKQVKFKITAKKFSWFWRIFG